MYEFYTLLLTPCISSNKTSLVGPNMALNSCKQPLIYLKT